MGRRYIVKQRARIDTITGPVSYTHLVVLSDVGDDMHRLGFTWAEIEDMELEAIA